jgi:hypothetical protein
MDAETRKREKVHMRRIELAGIEYGVLSQTDVASKMPVSTKHSSLYPEYGVLAYNPKAAEILNKRVAATSYVLICSALGRAAAPDAKSRLYTMACMGHYKDGPTGVFTSDFIKNCDDNYIRDAAKGFGKQDPRHQKWVDDAIKSLKTNQTALEFACKLYADIHSMDALNVLAKLKTKIRELN